VEVDSGPSRDAWGYTEAAEEFYHDHPELRALLYGVSLWVTVVLWPISGSVGIAHVVIQRWRRWSQKVDTAMTQENTTATATKPITECVECGLPLTDEDIKSGATQGFVEWLALHEPKTAAALFARVMPYFIGSGAEVPEVMSDVELEAQLKELGLPVGLIEHMQTAPAPLDLDELDDPYGLKKTVG
jgi:hypothetical protein